MPAENAIALVVRGFDWSESSRIVTLWSREFGKLRVLAKGGRRLNSSFEVALDLLNVCRVAVIRKSSAGLDLLTEAQVAERFPKLRSHLPALYAAYYVAELLSDGTEDYDPHPALFDATLAALRGFGEAGANVGPRLAAYELTWLHELGYSPALDACAACGRTLPTPTVISASAGGVVCADCAPRQREKRPITPNALRMLKDLGADPESWQQPWPPGVRQEIRQLLGSHVTYRLNRRLRTLPYVSG
jgi:DNA repair protein RecO (recombination protein O)